MADVHIATAADTADRIALRAALWPEAAEHAAERARMAAEPERFAAFLARRADGAAIGLAEVSMRHDYVNGCKTSPVGFLEGIYVVPAARRAGVARALLRAAEAWAAARGAREFASDALLDNRESHAMHEALGFRETERVVAFHKTLPDRARG